MDGLSKYHEQNPPQNQHHKESSDVIHTHGYQLGPFKKDGKQNGGTALNIFFVNAFIEILTEKSQIFIIRKTKNTIFKTDQQSCNFGDPKKA